MHNEEKNVIRKKIIWGIFASAILIALDQVTKFLAVKYLKNQPAVALWKNVFELQYLENRGAAFGILQGKKAFFVIATVLVLILLVYIYLKKIPEEPKFRYLNIIAIVYFSGAIGNFIDRIAQNYVVDFFYFKLIDFPIFNVADIYVVVATVLLIILGLFYYKEEDFEKIFHSKKEK